MRILIVILWFIPLVPFAQDWSQFVDTIPKFKLNVEEVPNNRPITGSRISDVANVLTDSTETFLDSLLIACEDSSGYEVAVVCLDSIGKNDPNEFGTDLFNFWGIGKEGADNGLLILLVIDIHHVEFITGRGTEQVLTDAMCYDIQQEEMVPHFRNDDYNAGIINGVKTTVDVFNGSPPLYLAIEPTDTTDDYLLDPESDYPTERHWFGWFYEELFPFSFFVIISTILGAIPALIFLIMLFVAFFNTADYFKKYKRIYIADHWLFPLLVPVPFILFYILLKILKRRWKKLAEKDRFMPKIGRNGNLMKLLSFEEQDLALAKGTLQPDVAKSNCIDVWATNDYSEVQVCRYEKVWSAYGSNFADHGEIYRKYTQCPGCKFKMYERLNSEKTGETKSHDIYAISYLCHNCGLEKEETVEYEKYRGSSSKSNKTKSKKSGIKWYAGSSSSSSSGSSSSSKSSGSSWGGGSSGGGGAGSSW